jgi:hypothetical protein
MVPKSLLGILISSASTKTQAAKPSNKICRGLCIISVKPDAA